ncbi:protein phosphatase 2C domain-containing protein [Pseudofrankia sp. DC12]|uniref:protein phosphatase 2C domain-containing protein n=1 Tax=Pseudofrankia sp. DC12 TaxID=683315 RepID=UPI0005F80FCD|nr:protein phosphatase 2C domain-containing protein [Pseudofrankia sp. DC12]
MKSSLLPIMLIVVLVVGATVFVVLSSRSSRTTYGPGAQPPPTQGGSRSRRRGQDDGSPPDTGRPARRGGGSPFGPPDVEYTDPADLVPGLGQRPAAPAPDVDARRVDPALGQAWRDDVTTQVPTDGGWPADDRDPDATGWAPPPSGAPHPRSADPGPAPAGAPDATTAAEDDAWNLPAARDSQPAAAPASWLDAAPPAEPVPAAPVAAPSPPAEPATVAATAGPYVAEEPEHFSAPPLRLAAAGRTRRGKRGGPNEDAFVVVDGLLAVADGVGGEAAGQIASTLAVTTVAGFRPQYAADPREGLRAAVVRANKMVRERPRSEPSWRGMACTLDVVVLGREEQTGRAITVAHVGDSTVWLQPGRGEPRQLTTPHAITGGPLLNAIGLADEVEMDLFQVAVQAGDRVVLSSDGMTKVMKPEQLYGLLHQLANDPPERAADALVEAALLAGARDDTTVVVADLVQEPAQR